MEKSFQSLSIFQFQEQFPDKDSCKQYLMDRKWKDGFKCPKCGHTKYCKVVDPFSRKCTKCTHIESVTAGTLFHNMKFSILKAFWIVYYLSTSKKGIASTELSRKLELRQKTCWLFKMKVMQAMKSSDRFLLEGDVEVDEFVIGGQEEGFRGRKNGKKKLVILAIERKGSGISRAYAKVISQSSVKEFKPFFEAKIDKSANITTDGWSAYKPIIDDFKNLVQIKSGKKGENFKPLHRWIMNFKSWLRGVHHHASHLQYYLDEYCYRFNRHKMKEGIFDNLLMRMITTKPVPYKLIVGM